MNNLDGTSGGAGRNLKDKLYRIDEGEINLQMYALASGKVHEQVNTQIWIQVFSEIHVQTLSNTKMEIDEYNP